MDRQLGGLIALLLVATNVGSQEGSRESKLSLCKTYGAYAGAVMRARQGNAAMSEVVDIASRTEDEDFLKTKLAIIKAAYEEPRYASDSYRASAVRDFENQTYLACLKSGGL